MRPARNQAAAVVVQHVRRRYGRLISHEAEDRFHIPDVFKANFPLLLQVDEDEDEKSLPFPTLYWALYCARDIGKGPVHVSPETVEVLNIEGRLATFKGRSWKGPPIADVAKAGFFCVQTDSKDIHVVECGYCGKKFRFRCSEEEPWVNHKKLSPNCPYLRAVRDHGANPSTEWACQLDYFDCLN